MMKSYPLLFEPNLHAVVWGGNAIAPWKGLPASSEPIGESWEVSCVPQSVSVIANGPLKGKLLTDAISVNPAAFLGTHVAKAYGGELPLLAKFIDARDDLSIQVHPNDEMAARLHGKRGKAEMWYVIDARPGAYLYAGFSEQLAPLGHDGKVNRAQAMARYKQLVHDGTITSVLAKHEVKAGDVFYLPAGRVHTICSGILLVEVQQSSDVTYRIFDYNRPGMDGKPRELHTELAAEALDYNVYTDYRTVCDVQPESDNKIIESSLFNVRLLDFTEQIAADRMAADSFVILMALHGSCVIRLANGADPVTLREGYSALIPADNACYTLAKCSNDAKCQVLEAYSG